VRLSKTKVLSILVIGLFVGMFILQSINGVSFENIIATNQNDEMNFVVSNMPTSVMIDDNDKDIWFNISKKITIEIFGDNFNKPMNASIEITGCGLNVVIEENEALEKESFIDIGKYEIKISPKCAGILTISVTNSTENKYVSKDFTITGLTGSLTTSIGDDNKIIFGITENIILNINHGQYCGVHLTWFDKNWEQGRIINKTWGDGETEGEGLNGNFIFVITENDIPYNLGYIVVVVKAGSRWMYDIVEIDKPLLKKIYMRGRITNINQLNETSSFYSNDIRCITFPFSMNIYDSNEKIIVSNNYLGILTKSFIFGFFEGKII